MTFSPLISGTVPHHNKFSSRGGRPITRLIQHHWAGTGGGIERMSDKNQQASCTYIITTDGQILGHVPEEYRPWTSGSAEADAPSVTIEVQNTGGQVNGNDSDPASWPISDAAYGAIIRLLVDVAQRHGWPAIDTSTYVGHRQFYSTACPGGFLWARMDQTRKLAQEAFTGGINYSSQSITPLQEEDDMGHVDTISDEAAAKIAQALLGAKWGAVPNAVMGELLNEYRSHNQQIIEAVEGVAGDVMTYTVDGVAGDRLNLDQFLREYRSHVIQVTSSIAAEAAAGGASVAEIQKAVADGLSAGIKIDATVKVGK